MEGASPRAFGGHPLPESRLSMREGSIENGVRMHPERLCIGVTYFGVQQIQVVSVVVYTPAVARGWTTVCTDPTHSDLDSTDRASTRPPPYPRPTVRARSSPRRSFTTPRRSLSQRSLSGSSPSVRPSVSARSSP